ncbi:hypothetical protein QQF64_004528 [Cirrhinus molitorella]|uniref:Transposase element L1Md-A101/L1Md-A102/L1Md-A2 n=1 Tax=Cirrhinus molitorella TaxID=172907 RepID=A0ABR3MGI2_9TELE
MPNKPKKTAEQATECPRDIQDICSREASAEANKAVLEGIAALQSNFQLFKAEITEVIDKRLDQFSVTIRAELTAIKKETDLAISAVKNTMDGQAKTMAELERSTTYTSDTVCQLQKEVERLTNSVSQLTEKCTDLESRSRRQNLRILNIKEGEESGRKATDFVAHLLKNALSLDALPLIDRAHRSLRQRSDNTSYPRAFIVRLHYFHDWQNIIRKAAQLKSITYNGEKLLIFPDLPAAILKQRARFNRAKELLRDRPGVRFGFLYPAKLRVTHNGEEAYFTDPGKAIMYAEQHFGEGRVSTS